MKVTIRNSILKGILEYDLGKLTTSLTSNLPVSELIVNKVSLLHGFVTLIPMQVKNAF
jgi:hypothetical protein